MSKPEPFKTFVVSLERAVERRAHMQKLLKKLGLEAQFIKAVDGAALTDAQRARYDRAKANLLYGSEMTGGEIACYLSHYQIYEHIVASDIEVALILEDDIDCVEDLRAIVRELALQEDPQWTVVRLQSAKVNVVTPDSARAFGAPVAQVAGRTLCRLTTTVLGGCAYLIRREAAAVMLEFGRRIFLPIDHTLDRYWENGIVPFVIRPLPVWQNDALASAIGPRGSEVFGKAGTARKRARRAIDGFNKRAFHLAFEEPWLARGLSAIGLQSARLALASQARRPALVDTAGR
jgi:glycosyl transferase family 25